MAEAKINRVHRKLTAKEKQAVEQGRRWAKENKAELDRLGRERFAEIETAHRVMQMLRAEREKRGLSLDAVAQRAGMDKGRLSKLENDLSANPTFRTVSRIARAMQLRLTVGLSEQDAVA